MIFTRIRKRADGFLFEPEKYNKLLGTNIKPEEMLSYFKRLELGYDKETNEVLVPSWRQDLECDADLAEEVARFLWLCKHSNNPAKRRSYYRNVIL